MFNLGSTLDTVIAMVVVILVLSLLVQAIQGFIKKIFKLKSKEIEKSLVELFKNIIDRPAAVPVVAGAGAPPAEQPTAPTAANQQPTEKEHAPEKELVQKVLDEFNGVGRYTKWGRTVLDSISKEDLLKVLARVDSKYFYADYVTNFKSMYEQIKKLEDEIKLLVDGDLLRGAASAQFAEMREILAPMINDVKLILSGDTVKPNVLFGDLINLRRIKLDDALGLLSQAQESVAKDLQAERQAGETSAVTALRTLSAALAKIAGIIGQLGQQADIAFATLRTKLDHVELWYDTVMQSFKERYTRHMKNVAIYISIAVVIFLNASFFRVYRSIATSDQQRNLIVKAGEQWLEEKKRKSEPANANPANTPVSNGNARANDNRNTNANGNTNTNSNVNAASRGNLNSGAKADAGATPSPAASATPTPTTLDDLKSNVAAIKEYASTYEDFGFSPLTWTQFNFWLESFFAGRVPTRDKEGQLLNKSGKPILKDCKPLADGGNDCEPGFREMVAGEWWSDRRSDISHLFGWFFMVLLLSVGAPFWQDTLESLFGIKNLLRKKSDTGNVEQGSCQGQTRS